MDQEEIKKILPHRDNMLLIDRSEILDDNSSVGTYTVRGDEFFLKGHFPGNPVVPGVILCEMLAQSCCVLLAGKAEAGKATPYFTTLNNVKFKKPVKPGDVLEMKCVLTRTRLPFFFAEGKGYVDGKLAVCAEFSFALVPAAQDGSSPA